MELEAAQAFLSESEFSILLAEDSDSNVALIQLYFAKTNCTLDVAADGKQAVEMFQSTPYDLVLMDIQMPIMDGYEATRLIREYEEAQGNAAAPIIAVTANIHDEERDRCRLVGCTDFLPKPIRKANLLGCVADYLQKA